MSPSHFCRVLVIVLMGVAAAGTADAQSSRPIKAKDVKGFISSYAEVVAFGEKHDIDPDSDKKNPSARDMSKMYQRAVDKIRAKGGGLYRQFTGIVRKHGFSSPNQWADVSGRIVRAYMAIRMGAHSEQMKAQMAASIQQIQSNPNIPPDQKQQMLQQMQASSQMMQSFAKADPADKKALQPYLAQLDKAFEETEKEEKGGRR